MRVMRISDSNVYRVRSARQRALVDGDFAPPVRDLVEQGYPLIGGRLDYVGGRDVAALVYQLRKHYINVFIWPDDGKQRNRPEFVSKQGYNVACGSSGGMRLCGVTDANAEDLRQFMQLLTR